MGPTDLIGKNVEEEPTGLIAKRFANVLKLERLERSFTTKFTQLYTE